MDRRERGGAAKTCWGDVKLTRGSEVQGEVRRGLQVGMEGFPSQGPGAGKPQASQVGVVPFRHGKNQAQIGYKPL